MKQIKSLINNTIVLILCLALLSACGSTSTTTEKPTKKKENAFFVMGSEVGQDESYSHIVGNMPRLNAMLTGLFVQYNARRESEKDTLRYVPWMVNDGKDSVMLYVLPVGEPNKIGYWMYEYQYMTSLPDEPIHAMFVNLVEINRDSIRADYYDAPEGFEVPLDELITNPKDVFNKVDVAELSLSQTDAPINYVRKKPLLYVAEGEKVEDDILGDKNPGGFKCRYYVVRPQAVFFGFRGYDKDLKLLGQMPPTKLLKEAMIKSDLPKK